MSHEDWVGLFSLVAVYFVFGCWALSWVVIAKLQAAASLRLERAWAARGYEAWHGLSYARVRWLGVALTIALCIESCWRDLPR